MATGENAPTEHNHDVEPTDLALKLSQAHRKNLPAGQVPELCDDCGSRLAQAIIEWSDWVIRRVEKVRFRDDRSVNRQISVDFVVRPDAPVFRAQGADHRKFWLVPVSIMRRKTLVNFDLHDEDGDSLPLPGLRLTQHLDESMLHAVARSELAQPLATDTASFIHKVIAGTVKDVQEQVGHYERNAAPAQIQTLKETSRLFDALFRRLSYHFVLYSFVEIGAGRRHRIIHMSTDEPLALYYRKPGLPPREEQLKEGPGDHMVYERGARVNRFHPHQLGASLGLIPAKIRFPVPAAENAASFHFEVAAPPGVDIVEASMLAGRPYETDDASKMDDTGGSDGLGERDRTNGTGEDSDTDEDSESDRHVSFDRVKLRLPTVGLHVAAVPNGSSSRAQVYLQVAVRGWYATMAVSAIVTSVLLFIIWRHLGTGGIDTSDLAALLVSVVAGVATLVTQGEFDGIAGRLLGFPRILAGIEALLLLTAAALFLFTAPAEDHGSRPSLVAGGIFAMFVIAVCITVIISLSWVLAYLRQRKDKVTSPWEMGPDFDPSHDLPADFWDGARRFGYTRPAIRVDSAEAWHHQFRWNKEIDQHALTLGQPRPAASTPLQRGLARLPGESWLRDRLPGAHNGEYGRGRSAVRGSDRG